MTTNSKSPNFLGIGSVRGGSTWLHEVLSSHEDFYLPTRRKEVQYLTKYWDKGHLWYEDFFKESGSAKWRGEITPGYLVAPMGPNRAHSLGSVEKLVLILRDPVERTISHYRWHLRVTGSSITLSEFVDRLAKISIENGLYFKHLKRYHDFFSSQQILCIHHEEAIQSPESMHSVLANFFEVDVKGFAQVKGTNASVIPKYRKAFKLSHQAMDWCRKRDLDFLPNLAIRFGAKKILQGKPSANDEIEITEEERDSLYLLYKDDIEQLEILLNWDLSAWKRNHSAAV